MDYLFIVIDFREALYFTVLFHVLIKAITITGLYLLCTPLNLKGVVHFKKKQTKKKNFC